MKVDTKCLGKRNSSLGINVRTSRS